MFRARIITVDHYMGTPIPELDVTYSDFRQTTTKHVPIIRIFGTTPTGDKTCIHVHGVFPYICVPYDGSEPHLKLSHQLAASLDKAINIASGYSTSNTQHVYKIVLVSGIPFYGYHKKRHQFLKIYFYKPSIIKQAATLLQNGAILNKIFQPHEAHTPFILQFFIDFNLYGMSYIEFEHVRFRKTGHPELGTLSPELILPDSIPAVSLSQFEIDVFASDISNRPSSQGNGQISNPGLAAIWEDEKKRRSWTDGTPLEAPQLHSQRPPLKKTSSEVFFLRKIQDLIENPDESGDDSSLSGEPAPLSNKSYAMEEPPNLPALDASFVSFHRLEPSVVNRTPVDTAYFEDTIVDEDLALMNFSVSQRLSQTLDRSITLDGEDLELLDALELLANTRSARVDEDSVLGSQSSRGFLKQHSVVVDDEQNSEGEDENWHDKTLVAEQDEFSKLLDLTMPDIDESAIMNDIDRNAPAPGSSTGSLEDLKIPQVDGACDDIIAGSSPSRRKSPKLSMGRVNNEAASSSSVKRRKCIIPQLDGANDTIPGTSSQKSLGIRRTTKSVAHKRDKRYDPETGQLIFLNKKAMNRNVTSSVTPSPYSMNPYYYPNLNQFGDSVNYMVPPIAAPTDPASFSVDHSLLHAEGQFGTEHEHNIQTSSLINPVEPETVAHPDQLPTEATVQNPFLAEPVSIPPPTSNICSSLSRPLLILPTSVPETVEQDPGLMQPKLDNGMMPVPYFSYDMPTLEDEVAQNLQAPPGCCDEGIENYDCEHDCGYDYINLLAKKESLLLGDPSLYPQPPPEKEESLSDLISVVPEETASDQAVTSLPNEKCNESHQGGGSVRRSSRLASRETPPSTVRSPGTVVDEVLKPEDEGDACLSSCTDIEISGCLPGLTTTMFQDLQENIGEWSSNADASCSDSEMCRLSGALENNRMEEILETGPETSISSPSASRTEVLLSYIKSQDLSSNYECVMEDPVTDELLRRGKGPTAGPPPRTGKQMELLQMHCSTPIQKATFPRKRISSGKEMRKRARQKRKVKLSISLQNKLKGSYNTSEGIAFGSQRLSHSQTVRPCQVILEKITKANVNQICRKYMVKVRDKTALGIKNYRRSEPKDHQGNPGSKSTPLTSKPSIVRGGRSYQRSVSTEFQYSDEIPLYDRLQMMRDSTNSWSYSENDEILNSEQHLEPDLCSATASEKQSSVVSSSEELVEESTSFKTKLRGRKKTVLDLKPLTPSNVLESEKKTNPLDHRNVVEKPNTSLRLEKSPLTKPAVGNSTKSHKGRTLGMTKLRSSIKTNFDHAILSRMTADVSIKQDKTKKSPRFHCALDFKENSPKKFTASPGMNPTSLIIRSTEVVTHVDSAPPTDMELRAGQVEHDGKRKGSPRSVISNSTEESSEQKKSADCVMEMEKSVKKEETSSVIHLQEQDNFAAKKVLCGRPKNNKETSTRHLKAGKAEKLTRTEMLDSEIIEKGSATTAEVSKLKSSATQRSRTRSSDSRTEKSQLQSYDKDEKSEESNNKKEKSEKSYRTHSKSKRIDNNIESNTEPAAKIPKPKLSAAQRSRTHSSDSRKERPLLPSHDHNKKSEDSNIEEGKTEKSHHTHFKSKMIDNDTGKEIEPVPKIPKRKSSAAQRSRTHSSDSRKGRSMLPPSDHDKKSDEEKTEKSHHTHSKSKRIDNNTERNSEPVAKIPKAKSSATQQSHTHSSDSRTEKSLLPSYDKKSKDFNTEKEKTEKSHHTHSKSERLDNENTDGGTEPAAKIPKLKSSASVDSRKEKSSLATHNPDKKSVDFNKAKKSVQVSHPVPTKIIQRKSTDEVPRRNSTTKAVSSRRLSILSNEENSEQSSSKIFFASNTSPPGLSNSMKDYKIPKKVQGPSSGTLRSNTTSAHIANSTSMSSIIHSNAGSISGSVPGIRELEPIAERVQPPNAEGPVEDENSLLISLDTSDIQLHLSSENNSVEENTKRFANKELSGRCSSSIRTQECNYREPGNIGRVLGRILCVDGASNESSSDSSTGSQNHGKLDVATYLKRNPVGNDASCSEEGKEKDLLPPHQGEPVPSSGGIEIPKSVAAWFAKPYGPWSMWSPNSSPNAHHHAHLFSPPRAMSPGVNELSGGGAALLGHGCMDEEEESILTDDTQKPTTSVRQDSPVHPQQIDATLVKRMILERNCLDFSNKPEIIPEIHEDSSGRTSHSILDMFSEKSLCSDQENSNDGNVFNEKVSSLNLNVSPSNIDISTGGACLDEQHEGLSPIVRDLSKTFNDAESKLEGKIKDLQLLQNRTCSQESKSSRDSSELPCGQYWSKQCSGSNTRHLKTLSTVFKPAYKPPSRCDVLRSLLSLNIPEVVNKEPFFSSHLDVKKKMEVGGNVLALASSKSIHLEEFSSNIEGIRGLTTQQRRLFESYWGPSQVTGDLNQLMSCHLDDRPVLIAPIRRPPTVKDVALWLKSRKIRASEETLKEKQKGDHPNEEKQSLSAFEDIVGGGLRSNLDLDCGSGGQISLSSDKKFLKSSCNVEIIHTSTPDVNSKKSGQDIVPSPIMKSLHRVKFHAVKPKRSRKKLMLFPPGLSSVSEEDVEGPSKIELDVESASEPNKTVHDDTLKSTPLESQFPLDAASPLFRHVAEASACEIKGMNVSPGFKMSLENLKTVKTTKEYQYLTTLALEVHICTCGTLNPDPERDPIRAIFYYVCNDVPEDFRSPAACDGVIAVNFDGSRSPILNRCGLSGKVSYASDEKMLLEELISLVRHWDPDILAGFEIEMQSWGYVLQRASVLGLNLIQELSRIPNQKERKEMDDFEDNNGLSGLKVTGRIVLDAWRLFRSEVALQSYTFESLMYHVLHQRVSHHSFENLSRWWENPSHLYRWITVHYYKLRVSGVIKLMDQLDIIGRTSELARLFGIQFFEVLSRGSQFRVESMMLRLAKPLNYIPVSPSVQQRAHMRAPECIPLIMEPESRFYGDPVIVLDFQSLYPSMIISNNYCFSTCLGRVEHLGKSTHFDFGCSELRITKAQLKQLKDHITVSPNGVAFLSKTVRQGILPRMLEEILEARLAVKQSMKCHKNDHTLQRVLHARQLGLKLIANVTYGYTSANFSGRMPCIEVGDSVVSKGRETLERAISLVHSTSEWGARVVYGDTDSLFVLVPGRSRQEAFRIGAEIAAAVTQDNPSPVKLKLEKVYQPCILQTKKRYVGYMYESADQKLPVYEAKGIETVRRDGCPAVSKMLEKSLRILFETLDVSSVKKYVCHQLSKILAGKANIQDLIYAREYRGKDNYRPGACVPALELTKRWLRQDRRSEPRIGERVPYVIVNGPPGSALIHLVRHPSELLSDPSLRYNSVYYITRAIIPPLARCFSLLGADVLSWYTDLPRKSHLLLPVTLQSGFKKTISHYFTTMECACCGILAHGGVCSTCRLNPQLLATTLMSKLQNWEFVHSSITKICQSCVGRAEPLDCSSLDCPITYRRHQSSQKLCQSEFITKILNDFGISSHVQ